MLKPWKQQEKLFSAAVSLANFAKCLWHTKRVQIMGLIPLLSHFSFICAWGCSLPTSIKDHVYQGIFSTWYLMVCLEEDTLAVGLSNECSSNVPCDSSCRWLVLCQGPWEIDGEKSHPHDFSALASHASSCKGRAWVKVTPGVTRTLAGGQKRKKGASIPMSTSHSSFCRGDLWDFLVFKIFPDKHSVRQRKICKFQINSRENFSTPMPIILGRKTREGQTWWGFPLYKIFCLSEIKCNFECLINATFFFFNIAKNTCPWLQKYLALSGLKLSGSQLHLHYIITRWLWKKKELKKFCKSCL